MRAGRFIAAILIAGLVPAAAFGTRYQAVGFDELLGWENDDHQAALAAFLDTCPDIRKPEWRPLCAFAETAPSARAFFELFFVPVIVEPKVKALFTGYFEPILKGSLYREGPYRYPVYMKPPDLEPKDPALTREAIERGSLKYKGLEIAYVEDPVEAYFLHIQGSGMIKLSNGNTIRVGYAGENGHVYRSAPQELIRQGEIAASDASIEGLKQWFKENPEKGQAALWHNASYVFFRRIDNVTEQLGPFGALDRPITPMRSVAVDPRYVQLGAPVWVEKGGATPMRRLMIAQDVGSAIKGPQRADIFYGSGDTAGELAGQTKDRGRMVVLMPVEIANRLAPEGS